METVREATKIYLAIVKELEVYKSYESGGTTVTRVSVLSVQGVFIFTDAPVVVFINVTVTSL